MKKDLLIVSVLVVIAVLGVGVVAVLPALQKEDEIPKTIKSRPEPIAELPGKEEPRKLFKKDPFQVAKAKEEPPINKKGELPSKPIDPMPPEKLPLKPTKIVPPPKPIEVAVEPIKDPTPKIIRLGDDLIKLNDAAGEFAVKTMNRGQELKLIGKIKTLTIAGANGNSVLDATELVAEEILITGHINSGSKVLLGKAHVLKLRDVNDKSLVDASSLEAREILLAGAVNSGSTVKLHAVKGSVEIAGEINDRAQIEIVAPDSKVIFKSRGDSVINGDARVTVLARDVDFAGTINGAQTQLDITLTKDGTLKFGRLNGGVRLSYRKADAGDPEPRVESGPIDPRAVFQKTPALKK